MTRSTRRFRDQQQPMPGSEEAMDPKPDYGEDSYKGSGRLKDKKAVITGGDSGIGRAVALAFAREGADVLIAYYNEHEDAEKTKKIVEDAGRKAILMPGDIKDAAHCRAIVDKAVKEFGRIDILVNNAAHQATFQDVGEISDEEWDVTFRTNIYSMFYHGEGRRAAHAEEQRDHQHELDQRGYAEPAASCLRDDERRDPEFHRWPGAVARRKRNPGELRSARSDLDAAHSLDDASGEGEEFRQASADAAAGPAEGTRAGLRHAGERRKRATSPGRRSRSPAASR